MQTSQQLINAMLSGGDPERVGLFEGFWNETLDRWATQGYPTELTIRDGVEKTVPVDPFQHFHYDIHKTGGFFDTEPILGFSEVLEETDEWQIVRNGAGAAFKWWKHQSGTPEHIHFAMESKYIWEREYRPYLLKLNPDRFNCKWWRGDNSLEDDRRDLETARKRGQWAFYGHVFVWEIQRSILGDLSLYQNVILDPAWIKDVARVYTDFFKTHFAYLIEQNGPPDGIWLFEDLAYRNGLFISPQMYRDLVFPYYAEIVEFFNNEYNLPVLLHTDGKIDEALPLIVEAGFQGLNPMEVKAGCDIFSYAEQYKENLMFIGGLDMRILETNDHDYIRSEVRKLIEGMKRREACFIFGSDHTITPRVNYDSYLAALDEYRETMMY